MFTMFARGNDQKEMFNLYMIFNIAIDWLFDGLSLLQSCLDLESKFTGVVARVCRCNSQAVVLCTFELRNSSRIALFS